MLRRAMGLVLVAAVLLPLGGCYPGDIAGGILWFMGARVRPYRYDYKAKAGTTLEETVDADMIADFGGLDGTYDITLNDPAGGTFGSFSGVGTVKRGRFVTLKDDESGPLFSTVAAMLSKALGGESVNVTKAKATVKAFQTPGGVEKHFSATISFTATITSGPDINSTIKGKFESEGQF